MSKSSSRHLLKHGLFAGWKEYRYGGGTGAVSLAGTKAKPILSKARREAMVDRVAHLFEDHLLSPFENEAPIRHGLRQAFCLTGHSWRQSDNEAEYLTETALKTLGIERPSWIEGQRDYAGDGDYCSWCHGPIGEDDPSRRTRFCSVDCARAAVVMRSKVVQKHDGGVRRSALRMITKEAVPPRPCGHCGSMFKSDVPSALYCSRTCSVRAYIGDRLMPDIVCEGCGKTVKASNRDARFCSLTCRSATIVNERREKFGAMTRQCTECGSDFAPASERTQFCSAKCGSLERNRRYRARQGQASTFTYTCRCCGIGFSSRQPRAPYCSKRCKDLVIHIESGKTKRMTVRVFDYLFDPPSTRALVEALFEPT